MDIIKKMEILTESAKYDVACTSSGSQRKANKNQLGSSVLGGICHSFSSDGRCISLLKILQTNKCVYNCQYCVNRRENDVARALLTPQELADICMNFYKRNYIEGLFLSSAVVKSPDYTMELMYQTIHILRKKENFNGYIHVKAIPGASKEWITALGYLVDRMSVNIELPSKRSLALLAPDKKNNFIIEPMKLLTNQITENRYDLRSYKKAKKFVPAGQSTQMIVGATKDSDKTIITMSENLYKNFSLKRVFYSAYSPVHQQHPILPNTPPPLLREHRLYQADFLMRFYAFNAGDILGNQSQLSLDYDPKVAFALRNLHLYPMEINTASYHDLLKVPGIGVISVKKIIQARKNSRLDFYMLKKMGISLKRAKYFIVCKGKRLETFRFNENYLTHALNERTNHQQLSIFDNPPSHSPKLEEKHAYRLPN